MTESSSSADVLHAASILKAGGLVAIPTETVYGLGANALNVDAVARVFEAKGRPHFDPLIVHVAEMHWIERLTTDFPPVARKLAERFWPGPLTLILPKQPLVPDLVTSGLPSVAIRIPDHPLAQALLRAADLPIAAPSANPFGRLSPTTAAHVREQLGDRIDFILDGGPCRVGVESTVLQVLPGEVRLLRPGGITLEEIESVIGHVALPELAPQHQGQDMVAPGMLTQHYAPRTRLLLVRTEDRKLLDTIPTTTRTGLLSLRPWATATRFTRVEVLSDAGDLREAAAKFFAAMRSLDAAGLDLIVAELFPEQGLGRALNDRLRRAAADA